MKKWIVVLLLFVAVTLLGQDYIHRDYYGQGATYEAALEALMEQVGRAVSFENSNLVNTYRADISRLAVEQKRNQSIQLTISGATLDGIFQARQSRAAGIVDQGRKASEDAVRKVYYNWGWYYLSSLPPGHRLPGREELRQWLLAHKEVTPARLPVPMTYIEREVAAIREIVGSWDEPVLRPQPVSSPKQDTLQARPVVEVPQTILAGEPSMPLDSLSAPESSPISAPTLTVSSPLPVSQPSALKIHGLFTFGLAPEPVFGVLAGVQKKWGGVLGFQSNFVSSSFDYEANSDGTRTNGEFVWPEGSVRVAHLMITAGGSYAITSWLSGFASAGYGYRQVFWQDVDRNWARIQDLSARGVACSGGVLMDWTHFAVSLSLSTVSFQTLGVTVGAGVRF